MTRPYSWYPLASSDPVPGNPVVVRAGGEHYLRVAEAIGDAERVLRAIVDAQDAVSEAVAAIRDRTHAVADRIRKAHGRYDAAGDALVGYATELDLAQAESLDALRRAQAAQRTVDVADDAARRWRTMLEDATDLGEDTTTQRRALTAARAERSDAEVELAHARAALEEAVARRDTAAERAITLLDDGMQDDTLQDSWWENWGADVAQIVSTWAGNISAGAGMLSLVLGWVPFMGPALGIIAVAAGAAALIADVALALKSGDGDDWFNVVVGLVGLVTFGAGRVLATAVDAFAVSARAARSQATQQASRSFASRLVRVLTRQPAGRGSDSAAKSLTTAPEPSGNSLAAAWDQVTSARGWDRLLSLAGHGDLVAENALLRAQLWDAFPFRPVAFVSLIGPTIRGTVLKGGASVLFVGDVAMAMTASLKAAVDLRPAETPAERLRL